MSNPTESWGYNPEQGTQLPVVSEGQSRIDAFRTSALETARQGLQSATEKGKEGFVNSVESGKAEEVGRRAIDIAAKTAEQSLKTLPLGTRTIGKFVGKRVISRLQDEGHARLGGALDTMVARVDTTPQLPASPDVYSFSPPLESTPVGGWGAPAEIAPQGFGMEPAAPIWGAPTTEAPTQGFTLNQPSPMSGEGFWYNQPNPPVAELPSAAKEGLLKRLRKKNDDTSAIPVAPEVPSPWGPTPGAPEGTVTWGMTLEASTGWGASDVQQPNESWWGK